VSRTPILVSVIIPTFNRSAVLERTLAALTEQILPVAAGGELESRRTFEVVVVDDGSTDDTSGIAARPWPFTLRYFRQANRGATVARNWGSAQSYGTILVFLDDDILLSPGTLQTLAQGVLQNTRAVIMGTLVEPPELCELCQSHFARMIATHERGKPRLTEPIVEVDGTRCKTGLLALRHSDFDELGRFQDPTGGWPNWDDVDFGVRANRHGYRLMRLSTAVGTHWDYSIVDLPTFCQRSRRASRAAVQLFKRYPGLDRALPMFYDMTPIRWGQDSARLVCRKLVRRVASTRPVMALLETSARCVERRWPRPRLLWPFYRWIHGGYVYIGFQEGLAAARQSTRNTTDAPITASAWRTIDGAPCPDEAPVEIFAAQGCAVQKSSQPAR
jgi:glycosyltransferase involved in cell wall biosynthesis